MRARIRLAWTGAALLMVGAGPTLAQPPLPPAGPAEEQPAAPGQRPGRGAAGEGLTVAAIERELDRFEIVQAQRALGLDNEAFEAVGVRLQRIQVLRRRHQAQRRMILAELRAALESGTIDSDAAGVTARLTELGNLTVRQAQELRRASQAMDAVLSLRQRAQFRLFQERFERQKLDLLSRARQPRGAGRQPGRRPR